MAEKLRSVKKNTDILAALKGNLERTLSVSENEAERSVKNDPEQVPNIKLVPINEIKVGGVNTRTIDDSDQGIDDLAENIRQHGLINPITITLDQGGYRLLAGERRYRAIVSLGRSEILANIVDVPPEQWRILMAAENLLRKDFEPWEEAQTYRILLSEGYSISTLAKTLNISPAQIRVMTRLTENRAIRLALEDRAISQRSVLVELNRLLQRDGKTEKVEGSIDAALSFVRTKSPSISQIRDWCIETISTGAVPMTPSQSGSTPAASRRHANTYIKREELRLQEARIKQAPKLSEMEIALLIDVYTQHVEALKTSLSKKDDTTRQSPNQ